MQKIAILDIKYNSPDYWELVRIREFVLRLPLFMRFSIESLQSETNEKIFGIKVGSKWIGSCQYQLFPELNIAKMRQVAILDSFQGKGFGNILISESEKSIKKLGIDKITCHARVTAIPFYESLHYQCTSEVFEEVGIPHKKMEKEI
jgi:ribosomal protein S18 acetylase RimI-like enzyme